MRYLISLVHIVLPKKRITKVCLSTKGRRIIVLEILAASQRVLVLSSGLNKEPRTTQFKGYLSCYRGNIEGSREGTYTYLEAHQTMVAAEDFRKLVIAPDPDDTDSRFRQYPRLRFPQVSATQTSHAGHTHHRRVSSSPRLIRRFLPILPMDMWT